MDVEEIKKIIQDKIEADEAASEVRKSIKSYIHQKQDAREGFTETFKPLIETSEKVKESVDTQQNKLIKQLQENQLALTAGFEGNRKAITSGFDKMDLKQILKPEDLKELEMHDEEDEEDEEELFKRTMEKKRELYEKGLYEKGLEEISKLQDEKIKIMQEIFKLKNLAPKYKDEKRKKILKFIQQQEKILEDIEEKLKEKTEEKIEESIKQPKTTKIEYKKSEMDRYLLNKDSIDILKSYGFDLPSKYKDLSLTEFEKVLDKGLDETSTLKEKIKLVADYHKDSFTSYLLAYPKNINAQEKTKENIKKYNIMQIFINNMNKLKEFKTKTGTGIIHFNNPQQLVDRLELLAGSIIAGNNGVKQEFSQIAHLLHQLKIITKKTLNDLLRKYILFK